MSLPEHMLVQIRKVAQTLESLTTDDILKVMEYMTEPNTSSVLPEIGSGYVALVNAADDRKIVFFGSEGTRQRFARENGLKLYATEEPS